MTPHYAVFYNTILAGLYKHTGTLAVFCKRENAEDYAAEMNAFTPGYHVEEITVKIKKPKKDK